MRIGVWVMCLGSLLAGVGPRSVAAETFDDMEGRAAEISKQDQTLGFPLWMALATRGLANAQYEVGFSFQTGRGVGRDAAEALRWYRRAAEQGHVLAQCLLAGMYLQGDAGMKDEAEAATWYRQAAAQGSTVAQNALGALHEEGTGVPQDTDEAVQWYRKAAEQGFPAAQFQLGFMYANAKGVDRNESEAAKWWEAAAQQGHALAQYELGRYYYYGKGVTRDYATAAHWFITAADQAIVEAQYQAGRIFANGQGVARNDGEAAQWFQRAAAQSHAGAQMELAFLYSYGRGVAADLPTAIHWFRKAAAQGVLRAQQILGDVYAEGVEGVPADPAEAAKWYARAADQGDMHAQLMAGWMNYTGDGVPRDPATALRWFRRAADQSSVQGQLMLGVAYLEDRTPYRDPGEALAWITKAADRGDPTAQFLAGSLFLVMQAPGVEPAQAMRWLQSAARQGVSEAGEALGGLCKAIPDACTGREKPKRLTSAEKVAPGSAARTADNQPVADSDPRAALELFSQVVAVIQNNYVEAVDPKALLRAAISGLLQPAGLEGAVILSSILAPGEAASAGDEPLESHKVFASALAWVQARLGPTVPPEEAVYAAIRGMMAQIDPDGAFTSAGEMKELHADARADVGGIGVELNRQNGHLTVVAPIDGGPADRAGVQSGDRILRIEGEPTATMTLRTAVAKLRGPTGSQVTVSLLREEAAGPVGIRLTRELIEVKGVQSQPLGDGLHHIRIGSFTERITQELQRELERLQKVGATGIVLDLRNNAGGALSQAVAVGDMFLEAGQLIVSTKGRMKNQTLRFVADHARGFSILPMVVLVNHGTVSGPEIVVAALQDWKRAVIVGVPTFAKGSIQTVIPLSDGSRLRLTTAKVFTPTGRFLGDAGINPDLVVKEPQPETAPGGLARLSRWRLGDVASDGQLQQAMAILRPRN